MLVLSADDPYTFNEGGPASDRMVMFGNSIHFERLQAHQRSGGTTVTLYTERGSSWITVGCGLNQSDRISIPDEVPEPDILLPSITAAIAGDLSMRAVAHLSHHQTHE